MNGNKTILVDTDILIDYLRGGTLVAINFLESVVSTSRSERLSVV